MFDFIFYILYKFAKRTETFNYQENATPIALTWFLFSVLSAFNIFVISMFYTKITGHVIELKKEHGIGLAIALMSLFYFSFVHNRRYISITKRFSKVNTKNRLITFYLYLLILCGLFLYLILTLEPVMKR